MYMRIRPGQFHQTTQHLIVQFVSRVHDSAKCFEQIRAHIFHFRRMENHELVADVIDGYVIGRAKIPGLFLHERSRNRVQGDALGEPFGEDNQESTDLGIALIESATPAE